MPFPPNVLKMYDDYVKLGKELFEAMNITDDELTSKKI